MELDYLYKGGTWKAAILYSAMCSVTSCNAILLEHCIVFAYLEDRDGNFKSASRMHSEKELCSKSFSLNKQIRALLYLQCILQIGKQHEKNVETVRINGLSKTQKICATPEPPHQYTGFLITSSHDLQHPDLSKKCTYTGLPWLLWCF